MSKAYYEKNLYEMCDFLRKLKHLRNVELDKELFFVGFEALGLKFQVRKAEPSVQRLYWKKPEEKYFDEYCYRNQELLLKDLEEIDKRAKGYEERRLFDDTIHD